MTIPHLRLFDVRFGHAGGSGHVTAAVPDPAREAPAPVGHGGGPSQHTGSHVALCLPLRRPVRAHHLSHSTFATMWTHKRVPLVPPNFDCSSFDWVCPFLHGCTATVVRRRHRSRTGCRTPRRASRPCPVLTIAQRPRLSGRTCCGAPSWSPRVEG